MPLRFIDGGILDPHWSASMDHALVDAVRLGLSAGTLHIYRRPPTISMGYFQPAEAIDWTVADEKGIAVLRRMSGGGTILNDEGQLIYTLAVDRKELPKGRDACLRLACAIIAQAVGSLGLTPVVKDPNDVLVRGLKVSGNSQLRSASAVALQGTVVLRRPEGMEALHTQSSRMGSLSEFLGRELDVEDMKRALMDSFAATLGQDFVHDSPTGWENQRASELLRRRYGSEEFIWGR